MLWFVACIILLGLLVRKVLKYHDYWREKGVPYEKSWPVLGEFAPIVFRTAPLSDVVLDIYRRIGERRYSGIYQFISPSLFLKDPDLIKEVAVRSFDHFVDHRPVISEEIDPITGRNLLALKGQEWHQMRATLSPAFTSSKMKFMFSLITACADQLVEYLSDGGGETNEIDVKDLFSRFSNDVIATCAFGLECNSLKQRNNDFYTMVKNASDLSGLRGIKLFAYSLSPKLMTILRVKIFEDEVPQFFRAIVRDTVKYREEKKIVRTDMIHLLMEARRGTLKHEDDDGKVETATSVGNSAKHGKELTVDDMVSQALIFVVAGFETSSTLMSFLTYEMALNPDVQRRLQEEIDETLAACDDKITYDALSKMKYMDMVVSGSRFALMETKAIVFALLAKFEFFVTEKTQIPIRISRKHVTMVPEKGFWLGLRPRP